MALSSLTGALDGPSNVSNLSYTNIKSKYYDFASPQICITMGNKPLRTKGKELVINEIRVELSAGYEASMASFRIYNAYNESTGRFEYDTLKTVLMLGTSVSIDMGYFEVYEPVFVGFVAGIVFGYEYETLPYIEVTAMDIKGIMMGGNYANSCKATSYGKAVKEILSKTGYEKLKSDGGITAIDVEDTPDAAQSDAQKKESNYTIELVAESDYEFVVKAAKKFNYDFFVDRGKVVFRKAKRDPSILMTLGTGMGMVTFRVEYSLTGLIGNIEARSMDVGGGKVITAKDSYPSSGQVISSGGKAKSLVGGGSKVYIDPTIHSQSQAEDRVAFLKEKMSYRLGKLEADCVGIPELIPGRFIKITGLGAPVDNEFYLTEVEHRYTNEEGFYTRITGVSNQMASNTKGG